ncbi:MAG: carbamate kinase [Candidatus Diapherotrites archaeon]|nr:carbamate kinase [Candidatus Diapherotrites archaeon]
MIRTIVIGLGGNALIKPGEEGTAKQQLRNIGDTVKQICKLVEEGHKIILTHGNGPQVGAILIQQEEARRKVPPMPLDVCVAQSQGEIGYMLQQTFAGRSDKSVVTVVTQVLVDGKDPAFKKPTKPIGPAYTEPIKGIPMVKTHKGYRRVVPSPDPKDIIEKSVIHDLIDNHIVVACGGGGIPVVKKGTKLKGVEAVIDKDLAGEKLAEEVNAELFVILTDVDYVYLDYGKPSQKPVKVLSLKDAKRYMKEGQFPAGSMGPKVKAAIRFLEWGGEAVIITSINSLHKAMKGHAGTVIRRA